MHGGSRPGSTVACRGWRSRRPRRTGRQTCASRSRRPCSGRWGRPAPTAILVPMPAPLIEFPADDSDRALRFWSGVLGVALTPRPAAAGSGWETDTDNLRLGVHDRGPGPGDTASLPYFTVADLTTTLERVRQLRGSVVHPGAR